MYNQYNQFEPSGSTVFIWTKLLWKCFSKMLTILFWIYTTQYTLVSHFFVSRMAAIYIGVQYVNLIGSMLCFNVSVFAWY